MINSWKNHELWMIKKKNIEVPLFQETFKHNSITKMKLDDGWPESEKKYSEKYLKMS